MRTNIFLIAMLLLGSSSLNAQKADKRMSFAVNVQPHVNWIHADEVNLSKGPVRIGLEGGLRLDYRFERFFAFSFGATLNQTGGNIIYNDALYLDLDQGTDTCQPGTRVTYRLQFLEIPLALKFLLPEVGYSAWFAEVGLDPMFNTKAFINATDNNIDKEPFKQGVSKINLAYHAGIGLNYSLGARIRLQYSIFYKNTFLDVTKENDIRKADNARINQIGINMGIVF